MHTNPGSERREEGLSRERVVDAAIELLDTEGENGLTFRALATRLATGPGALYWHIESKSKLLVAASDAIVTRAMTNVGAQVTPRTTIRAVALGVFEAIDAHPWVGTQLSRGPWQTATLQIFERIGQQIQALGVPRRAQFTASSVLVGYILGVSGQNAANGRLFGPSIDRTEVLARESARWKALDAHEYPFTRSVATHLARHDDADEFLAGIDLILDGIASTVGPIPKRGPKPA